MMPFLALAAAVLLEVPGTGVRLAPPPGFVAATNFTGFQQDETGASIMVMALPAPFPKATEGFNAAGLKTQGITLRSRRRAGKGARSTRSAPCRSR